LLKSLEPLLEKLQERKDQKQREWRCCAICSIHSAFCTIR